MKLPLGLGFLILFACAHAHAQKSTDDCAAEIGEPAATNRQLVADCLLESIGGAVITPRNPKVYVHDFGIQNVNSAGGVEIFADFVNPNKPSAIKYITIKLKLYNAVGDVIQSTIGGGSTKSFKYTGPLGHEIMQYRAHWGPAWYNHAGACVVMQSLSVEFMNGKQLNFSGQTLRSAMATEVKNSCKVE